MNSCPGQLVLDKDCHEEGKAGYPLGVVDVCLSHGAV